MSPTPFIAYPPFAGFPRVSGDEPPLAGLTADEMSVFPA